jgi:hypothetical protein
MRAGADLTATLTLEHPVRSRPLLTAPVARIMLLRGRATAIIIGRRLRPLVETRESTRIPTGRTTKKLKSNAEESARKLSLLSNRPLALALVPAPTPTLVPAPIPAPVPALVRDRLCRTPMFGLIMHRLPRARRTTVADLLTPEECRRMDVVTADRSEIVDACNNKSLAE